MAQRPIYISTKIGASFVEVTQIEFKWHAGMALSRKRMSIRALHEAILDIRPKARILEVSSASEEPLGESLSAFNLTFHTRGFVREIAVECAFQSAKVFERGGPFIDLMDAQPIDAKRDPRLKSSGQLIGFRFSGRDWPLEPLTAFYDWLYLNALHRRPELARAAMDYDTFTDIAFNPEKSVNCQAGSVALYVALARRNLLDEALASPNTYLSLIAGPAGKGVRHEETSQGSLL